MTKEIKTILVPTDFSETSEHALQYGAMLAKRFAASIHLVHACEAPSMATSSMDGYAIALSEWSLRLGEEAQRQLTQAARRTPDVKVSTEVLFGNPAKCIVTAATTNDADLIVMGTHGHGALLHLAMGYVAERVVRTAPCPVLTVRGPQAIEWHRPKVAAGATAAAAMIALTLLFSPLTVTQVNAQTVAQPAVEEMRQVDSGAQTFRTYCVVCHGAQGRGDGPLASSMRRKPADLSEMAKRNGGEYPSELAFRTIDGRQPIRGHGGPDMPVWGDAFLKSRAGGNAESVRETIESLVQFIGSIQARPVH